jgi:hypothetical protein
MRAVAQRQARQALVSVPIVLSLTERWQRRLRGCLQQLAAARQLSVFLQSVIFELSIGKKLPLPSKNWQILR